LLLNGNYFFTTIFAVESFVKLFAMSPRYFFAVSVHSPRQNILAMLLFLFGMLKRALKYHIF
jgi:hypothetical protein